MNAIISTAASLTLALCGVAIFVILFVTILASVKRMGMFGPNTSVIVALGPYTIHDMRRSCITNWAKQLPIHVVRQLAGHSDLKTTQRYYLSVQPDDMAKARAAQGALLGQILAADTGLVSQTEPGVSISQHAGRSPSAICVAANG